MRHVGCFVVAVAAAVLALVATAAPAAAMLPERLRIAADGMAAAGIKASGANPDFDIIKQIYLREGVAVGVMTDAGQLSEGAAVIDVAKSAPAGPVPGDFVLYVDIRAQTGPTGGTLFVRRVGLFLSRDRLLVYDSAAQHMEVRRRAEVDGVGLNLGDGAGLAATNSLTAFRLPAADWPGGHDDTAVPPGRVALADPGSVADDLTWSADHPREADPSLSHQLVMTFVLFVVPFVLVVQMALQLVLPIAGATFDGQGAHALLCVIGVVVAGLVLLAVAPSVFVGTVVGTGMLIVVRAIKVPFFSAAAALVIDSAWGVVGFAVTLLTGVEREGKSSLLAVAAAVVCAPVVWLRPLLASSRLRALIAMIPFIRLRGGLTALVVVAGRGGQTFGAVERGITRGLDTAGDLVTVRPMAIRHVVEWLRRRGQGPVRDLGAFAPTTAAGARRGLTWRGIDMMSLLWRPHAAATDAIEHGADLVAELDASLRHGMHGWPLERMRPWLLACDPSRRTAIVNAAAWTSRRLVPAAQGVAELSRTHWVAAMLNGTVQGHLPGPELNFAGQGVSAPAPPPSSPVAPQPQPQPLPTRQSRRP